MSRVKLFLDEDMHAVLSTLLRKRGFDVAHAQEMDRKGITDEDQLAFAAAQKRCLISFNVKDFARLHNEYVVAGKEHWGIVLSKQIPVGEVLRRVLAALGNQSRDSIRNRLIFLAKHGGQ